MDLFVLKTVHFRRVQGGHPWGEWTGPASRPTGFDKTGITGIVKAIVDNRSFSKKMLWNPLLRQSSRGGWYSPLTLLAGCLLLACALFLLLPGDSLAKNAKARQRKATGLDAFSSNPFGTSGKPLHYLYGGSGKSDKLVSVPKEKKPAPSHEKVIRFSGKANTAPGSRLEPKQQAPFMGGEHTLPYMDAEKSAELSLEYKMGPKTTTRIVVNPQDPGSPLYRPADKDKLLNSGGLYMDVEVQDNMQLKLGGEYCEVDDSGEYRSHRSSQGVAVGVQWNF